MIEHRWELWLVGWAAAVVIETTLYLVQRRTKDATLVDTGWAFSLVAIAGVCLILGPGCIAHRALIAVIAGVENLRVGLVVIRRLGHGEDSRYRELRRRWRERGREQLTFAIFYQAQALLAATLAIPFVLAAFDRHVGLRPIEWAAAGLWLVASVFQTIADEQLRRFKAVPENTGRTMRYGLWHYSRHPNYFFQSLTWVAYALVATSAPWGWLAWISPILLLYFVLFVTGVGPSEERALAHRGDDYRAYQQETSVFVPWFPKKRR